VSAKVEEFILKIDEFCAKINRPNECNPSSKLSYGMVNPIMLCFVELASNEIMLLKGLKFNLTVHSPFRAMDAIFLQLAE
jgi:hypothetical protein